MASSLATCLHTVGFEMPRVTDVVPLLDVDGIVDAFVEHLTRVGSGTVYCPPIAPLRVLCLAHMNSGVGLSVRVGGTVSFWEAPAALSAV